MHSMRHTDLKFNVLFQPSFYRTFLYIKVAIYLLKAIQISFWYSQDYTTVYFKNTFDQMTYRVSFWEQSKLLLSNSYVDL